MGTIEIAVKKNQARKFLDRDYIGLRNFLFACRRLPIESNSTAPEARLRSPPKNSRRANFWDPDDVDP